MLMKKQFLSLTEKGRWLLATLTLIFTLGIGQMWGADAVAKISFKNAGMATTYSATKISANPSTVGDVNVSWAGIAGFDKQYVSSTSTKDSCVKIDQTASDAYTTKYLQFSSSKVITKVELYAAIPGSTSAANEAIVGWSGEPSDTPDTVVVVSIPGKGTSNFTTINFPSTKGIKYVRCYRQIKIKDGKFDSKGSTYGSTTTWCVAYAQITTTESTSGGYSITYNCDDADYCPSTASGQTSLPSTLPTPKKAGYNFDGWYTTSAKTATVTAGGALSKDTTLYAKWTKVYVPQGANYSFAGQGTMGTAPKAITVTTDNKKNSIANYSRVDNIFFSAMDVYCESGTTGGDDAATGFKGWKIKTSGATIKFYVENDSRVSITMGTLSSGCNITYTAKGASSTTTTALTGGAPSYTDNYNVAAGSLVTLTTQGGNTITLKGIAVSEIPTISDNANLSDLKVGGTSIAGFDASITSYYYEMPYGTAKADLPLVTVETAEEHATVQIQDAKDRPDDTRATIKVTAQNGSTYKFYYVYFYNAPKYGVCLIKGNITDNAIARDAASYLKATEVTLENTGVAGRDPDVATGSKFQKGKHIKIELPEGKTFKEGDMVVVNVTKVTSDKLRVFKSSDNTEANIIGVGSENMTVGTNYVLLTEDARTLYLKRGSDASHYQDWNPHVTHVAVYRLMAPFIESFEIEGIDALTINQDLKTITADVANTFDVTALTPTVKYWANGTAQISPAVGETDFTYPVSYTVSSGYAEDVAPSEYAPVTYTVTINKIAPSETPNITTDPASANYIEGATIADLNVEASVTDEGTLSYQWQEQEGENWNDITNATSDSYTPTVSAIGTYKYRVVVTNTLTGHPAAQATSAVATIVIAEDPSCKAIGYGTTRDLALNSEVVIDATTGLKHISSVEEYDTGKKISGESNLKTIKLGGAAAYYDIYTTEKNIGSIALSLTSSSNGTNNKYAVIFCKSATFAEADILGVVEQTGGAGDEEQVINAPEVPLGTKLVRIKRQYTYKETTYGVASSSYIYYIRACLVEPAQEVSATVTAEPAGHTYCQGDVVTPLSYELSIEDGASAAYQWYKGTEAIENAEAATYTPTEAGVYKCKASLTKTGRLPKEMTSADATIVINTATAITAHADAIGDVDAEKTVSVTAEGTNLSYQWQACDESGVVTVETVLGTAASMNVTIAAEAKYYLATVTGACGVETQVVVVREWHEVAQADVTGYQKWDWNVTTNAAAWAGVANIQLSGADKTTDFIMANTSSTMPNNDAFHSDMLITNGEYPARTNQDGGVFQGYAVKFHATVPGKVTVVYRGTGGSAKVNLKINDWTPGETSDWKTKNVVVPAGDVVITDKNNAVLRIRSIEFDPNLDPEETEASTLGGYERDVTEGRYGTICLPNGGVMVGASIYTLAYYGETSHKIFFDEVLNGTMEAGKPYLFLPNENVNHIGVFYTDAKGESAKTVNGFVGYIGESEDDYMQVPAGEGNYIVQNNQYREIQDGATAYILSHRAYIHFAGINTSEPAKAPGARRIGISGAPQVVTGMDALNAAEAPVKVMINGQLYILRGEKMFDATGRLVK